MTTCTARRRYNQYSRHHQQAVEELIPSCESAGGVTPWLGRPTREQVDAVAPPPFFHCDRSRNHTPQAMRDGLHVSRQVRWKVMSHSPSSDDSSSLAGAR